MKLLKLITSLNEVLAEHGNLDVDISYNVDPMLSKCLDDGANFNTYSSEEVFIGIDKRGEKEFVDIRNFHS